MTDVVLYSYYRSSCAWRIRIALNLKEIAYEYRAVKLASQNGDQSTSAFKALNPAAQVPVLLIDNLTLFESVAIAEYLEETRPTRPLYPRDAVKRAQVRSVVEMINAGIQPRHNLATVSLLVEEYTHDVASRKKWAGEWITRGLQAVDTFLQNTAGAFCIGDEITFADCCLVPQVYSAFRFEVDIVQFPIVSRVFHALDKLPPFAAAHADRQPDAPALK